MFSTFIFAVREFFEAFIIVGIFLGISKKLGLAREKEILCATLLGIAISLLLPVGAFMLGENARYVLNERNAELLEGYLMIFSGFFIAYVVFSLHAFFVRKRAHALIGAHRKLERNIFDVSLFATIVFFVIREGFEIALFTGTASLFSTFLENIYGLLLGFAGASVVGGLTFIGYLTIPIGKIFKATEYLILLLGASFVKNGVSELIEVYSSIHINRVFTFSFPFLPHPGSFLGSFIKHIIGIEQRMGLLQLVIMASYMIGIYYFLMRQSRLPSRPSSTKYPL